MPRRVASAGPTAWHAWLVWSLGALFFTYAFFQRVAPSVMIDPLMRDLGVGAAVLGNLSAFYFYAYAGLQFPVGMMHDRWGPRRVLTLAALVAAGGSLLCAMAETVNAIYLGRLMIGAGAAFGFVGSLKLAGAWFPPNRFTFVSGLTMMLGMLGGILGQAPLALFVEAQGWRPAFSGAALAGVLLAVGTWIIVRDRPGAAPETAHKDSPAPQGPPAISIWAGLRRVLSQPGNWVLALIGATMTAPMLAFAGLWGVAWLMQTHGLARAEAAASTSLLMIGWAVGAPAWGALADATGRRRLLLIAATSGGLAALCALLYLPGLPSLATSALFFGTGLCLGAMVISFTLARETNPVAIVGTALAFVNMAVTSTGALFQPVIGLLLDARWDGMLSDGARVYSEAAYREALSVLPVFLALGLGACLFLLRDRPVAAAVQRA